MEKIFKILAFEVKEVAPRTLEFVGSTEDRDRMGDIIMSEGWSLKSYKKNPVFMWAHGYDTPPVGKATKVWVEDQKLKFDIQFASKDEYEFADTIYQLYKGGYLRATSVGFIPIESEPIETKDDNGAFMHQPTRYKKQELLELSGCAVPANPNALAEAKKAGVLTAKSLATLTPQALDVLTDEAIKVASTVSVVEKPYPNEHACRLKDPDAFQDGSFRRTKREHEGKEYSVIMGRLKGESTMTEQAYRYAKDVWKVGEARSHCVSHDGSFEPAQESKAESQEEIQDEMDYLALLLKDKKIITSETAWDVMRGILRSTGSDIPVDIAEKIGAVLNKKNRERLDDIKRLAQEVLDSAEHADEPDEKALTEESITELVAKVIADKFWELQRISRR